MILPHESAGAPAPLDLDLIRKYSVAGPRYTSYPPATRFVTDITPEAIDAAIAEDNRPGAGPISLYFHLPFCESLCWYCGCNTIITRRRGAAADYLEDLRREVALTARRIAPGRLVTQIHFGGGTPTFFPPEQLARLGLLIYENFQVDPDCEFSCEIDPRRLTSDHVEALRVMGVNRASLGVQDLDPAVQLAIHRWQPAELSRQAFEWLRAAGFRSVSVDLIYGLPKQTAVSFGRTIDEILKLGPDRLSVFSYAHVPWLKPAQRIFEVRGELPPPEEKLAMAGVAHDKLTAAGYVDIGLDHFARPDDELAVAQRDGTLQRNFQGYSTRRLPTATARTTRAWPSGGRPWTPGACRSRGASSSRTRTAAAARSSWASCATAAWTTAPSTTSSAARWRRTTRARSRASGTSRTRACSSARRRGSRSCPAASRCCA